MIEKILIKILFWVPTPLAILIYIMHDRIDNSVPLYGDILTFTFFLAVILAGMASVALLFRGVRKHLSLYEYAVAPLNLGIMVFGGMVLYSVF